MSMTSLHAMQHQQLLLHDIDTPILVGYLMRCYLAVTHASPLDVTMLTSMSSVCLVQFILY